MTRYLLTLGHRRIAFIKGHPNQTASAERWLGFETALREADCPNRAPEHRTGGFQLSLRLGRCRKALGGGAEADRHFREQRRHGRSGGVRCTSQRARCPAQSVCRRLRRHGYRDHRVAGADHDPPTHLRDGRSRVRSPDSEDTEAPRRGRACVGRSTGSTRTSSATVNRSADGYLGACSSCARSSRVVSMCM